MSVLSFEDYLAICNAKARYCRFLDEKNWPAYGALFTEDAELDTRPSGGEIIQGRAALVAMVQGSLALAKTAHHIHSPEISLLDDNTAEAIFAMQDYVEWDAAKAQATGMKCLTGFGHYRERYVRCDDGQWRIASSTLTRLHINFTKLED